jgi:hypothetical protein
VGLGKGVAKCLILFIRNGEMVLKRRREKIYLLVEVPFVVELDGIVLSETMNINFVMIEK